MAMKAVCVLKGDGPVQGTIHFEQKARLGGAGPGERDRARGAGRAPGTEGAVHAPAAACAPLGAESPRPPAGAGPGWGGGGRRPGFAGPSGRVPFRAPERSGPPDRALLASVISLGLLLFRCPCPRAQGSVATG